MSRVDLALTDRRDDARLRDRMARAWIPSDWIPGVEAISLCREPSYFDACRLQGDEAQVLVGRERDAQGIVLTGTRHVATTYHAGRPTRTAFLGDLRIDPAYRNGLLLARTYRFLRGLHEADPLPAYTLVYEANVPALQALVGARAGLPAYLPRGRIVAPVIRLDERLPRLAHEGLELRRAMAGELDDVIAFVNRRREGHDWAPVLRAEDFRPGGRCDTLAPEDFFLALAGGRIVGTVAAWDQSTLRQVRLKKAGEPPDAAGHDTLPYLYLAFTAAQDDDTRVFRALLRHACDALAEARWPLALAALHEDDPLAGVLSDYGDSPSIVRLYEVDFELGPGESRPPSPAGKSPRVEFAMT